MNPAKTLQFFLLFNLFFFGATAQTTHLVTNNADSGPGSLRDAVASAANADTIRFSAVSFTGQGVQIITLTSNLIAFDQDSLVFKGFYNASGDTVKVNGNNVSGVLNCDASNSLTIDSMVIINALSGSGSGVHTSTEYLIVNNSIFGNNRTNYYGGAIYANNISINNSFFYNNSAPMYSAGAINATQKIVVANSIFTNNTANSFGGAILCDSVIINNSSFSNNSAGGCGAIYAPNYIYVSNSIFAGNTATANDGGAIDCAGNTIINNSTFSNNSAFNRGGGAFDFNGCSSCGNITITNSTFNGNTANSGGGVYACTNVTATNSTFTKNVAEIAGGICAGLTNAINSTITGNTATFVSSYGPGGGGIEGVSIEATSSIIALNTGGDIIDVSGRSILIASGGHNIFTDKPDGTVSTDQTAIDSVHLKLGSLQSNGGITFTILPGKTGVAIAKGNPIDLSNDQRDFSIPSGTVRDVGAVTVSAISPMDACHWTGFQSKAWENPSNWDCGHIPVASTVVSINAAVHYPVINSTASCKSLTLTLGVSCLVNTGGLSIISK